MLQQLSYFENVLENHQRILIHKPFDAVAHNNCGNALLALKRFDEALTYFDKAVTYQPK